MKASDDTNVYLSTFKYIMHSIAVKRENWESGLAPESSQKARGHGCLAQGIS